LHAPARDPPALATDVEQAPAWEGVEPIPEIQFDQRQDW